MLAEQGDTSPDRGMTNLRKYAFRRFLCRSRFHLAMAITLLGSIDLFLEKI